MPGRIRRELEDAMDSASEKLKFGLWGAGVLAVFLFHLVALVGTAVGGEHAARVWSILLLIAAPVSVVGLIAVGFVRAGGRERERTAERGSESNVDS